MTDRQKRRRIEGTIRANTWTIAERAVEEGIAYGLGRCAKYDMDPQSEAGRDHILRGVMMRLSDDFTFHGPDPD